MRTGCIAILLLVAHGMVSGHSCLNIAGLSDKKFQEYLDQTQTIFFGEIISIEPSVNNSQKMRVRVLRAWKGANEPEITLTYVGAYAPFEDEVGPSEMRRTFFAHVGPDGGLRVFYCDFDQRDARVERMMAVLGEGTAIEEPIKDMPSGPPEDIGMSPSFILGAIFVLVAVGLFSLIRFVGRSN